MSAWTKASFLRLYRDQSGQMLPVITLMIVVFMGMTGIAVDVGHVYLCHRELQASADAAALAGATAMAGASTHPLATTAAGVKAIATNYSSVSGSQNVYANLSNVTMVSGYPLLECLNTLTAQGIACAGYVPYNAIQVKLQAAVPMYFSRILGLPSMTIAASASAAKGGGPSRPYNVAIVIDSTGTMNSPDWNCDPTGNTSKLACSLQGIQVLLQHLDPCGLTQSTCSGAPFTVTRVSLFTFPQLMYNTVGNDYDCGTSAPTSTVYSFPTPGTVGYYPGTSSTSTTYRIIPFYTDYRTSDTATTLNPSSYITIAVNGVPGCSGITAPSNVTYNNTYYAAPIYAAQGALLGVQASNPGSENVMIILGDGDSNTPQKSGSTVIMPSPATANASYPSWLGECSQGVTAAQSLIGTVVYSVAYGAPASGCAYDQDAAFSPSANKSAYPNITPCGQMTKMATYSWTFFSDYLQSGSNSTCVSPNSETSLAAIFQRIAGDLTEARIISDTTT